MRVALFLLCVGTVLVYSPLRRASFVYEDSNAVFANPAVIGQQPIQIFRARWLSATSHRIVWTLAGDRPVVHHAVNLGLHLVNGLLVYAIASVFLVPVAAWMASALYLLHPLNTEAVAYVASRSELLAACLALFAFWRSLTAVTWKQHLLVWTATVLAICAKESAVVVIPLMGLMDIFRGCRAFVSRYVALLIPAALMAYSVWQLDYLSISELTPWQYAATQAYAVWSYLGLIVLPIGQTVDHDFELIAFGWRYLALYGLVCLACVPLIFSSWADNEGQGHVRLWAGADRMRMIAFGCLWLVVAIIPRLIMRIPELLNEHQMLFPAIGVWIAIAACVTPTERTVL